MEDGTTLEEIICFRRVALRQMPHPGAGGDKQEKAQVSVERRIHSSLKRVHKGLCGSNVYICHVCFSSAGAMGLVAKFFPTWALAGGGGGRRAAVVVL